MTTSVRFRSLMVCLIVAHATRAAAQQAPNPSTPPALDFRIVTAGGFLGYLDGLVRPGETEGGILGFERFLAADAKPRDLLLITGNNMSHEGGEPFDGIWGRIRGLHPDAVALSIDDFRRPLRELGGIVRFMNALPAVHDIPLVASNAIIKARRKGLNSVSSADLSLEIAADESIGWVTKMQIAGGTCEQGNWTLRDLATPAAPVPAVTCASAGGHQKLSFASPLRPGRHYELSRAGSGQHPPSFAFYTHRPLITADDGLPVRYVTRPAGVSQAQFVVVAVVDPDTKKRLGADRWQWKATDLPCDGERCELDFLPGKDALAALAAWIAPGANGADPVFVLMSGLPDTPMLSLMSKLPDAPGHPKDTPIAVPIVLLDPDTFVLGQDLGHTSIVQGDSLHADNKPGGEIDPTKTQIWVRPPWDGARVDVITGRLAWISPRWQLTDPTASPLHVAGDVATWTPSTEPNTGVYTLTPSNTTLGRFTSYGVYSGGTLDRDVVWQSMAVLLLDIMRQKTHADLAVLPKHFIDEDIVKEVANETGPSKQVVFTRLRMSKLFYEMEGIVSVDVEGSKLSGALDALVKAEAAAQESMFVAGIGSPGELTQIDTKHLLVNGRAIVDDHFYKVAMPQSVAEAQGLTIVDHDAIPSLLHAVDEHLRLRGGPVLRQPTQMTQLDDDFAKRWQFYISANPAKFSYFRGSPTDEVLLGNIPLAGRSVKDERQWAVSGHGEIALDGLEYAARGVADVRFAKNIVVTPPSYPEDEWTAGGRFDKKLHAGVGRLFVGGFKQSQFREPQIDDITPTRSVDGTVTTAAGDVLTGVTVKGQPVHVDNHNPADPDKPAYVFARFGAEVKSWNLRPWLTAKDAAAAFDWGKSYNSRSNILLSGLGSAPIPIGKVYQFGLSKYIAQQFKDNPAAFETAQTLTFQHADYEQRRIQMDGTLAAKGQSTWPRWLRDSNLSLTSQFRRYFDEASRPVFTPNWSIELKPQLEWTVVHRLKMGPYLNYYRVGVKWPDDLPKRAKPLDYVKVGVEFNVPIFISGGPPRTFQ